MFSKGIKPVYLKVNKKNQLVHDYIGGDELFGINPLSDDAYYNFEAGFSNYEQFYTGEREKIDLVMMNRSTNENLIGLEIKLTALPDDTTKKYNDESRFSSELVVRPPTLCFLACGICELFKGEKNRVKLHNILKKVPRIPHWEDAKDVAPHYHEIENAVKEVVELIWDKQKPLVVQPVWKMVDGRLANDCLDVFVWSNLALLQLCYTSKPDANKITRHQRAIIWIFLMLRDFDNSRGDFDYGKIVGYDYGTKNDKAFSCSGSVTYKFLKCAELLHPRVEKSEIKDIILGGGQNLLSPERRFDAIIVNSPDLFK